MVRSGLDCRRLRGIDFDPMHGRSDHANWPHKASLVEIDALVALGGSRIARPSSERVPDRVSHRVSTHDFRTIQARPKDRLSLAPAGS